MNKYKLALLAEAAAVIAAAVVKGKLIANGNYGSDISCVFEIFFL